MRRVLIVEDSVSMRTFVRAALEASTELADVELVEAEGGFDALRMLPRGRFDLVITDVNMPDINGLELVRFIRQSDRHAETPILLISTRASDRDRDRGLALGASEFLAKPFTPEDLCDLVLKHFEKSSADT